MAWGAGAGSVPLLRGGCPGAGIDMETPTAGATEEGDPASPEFVPESRGEGVSKRVADGNALGTDFRSPKRRVSVREARRRAAKDRMR